MKPEESRAEQERESDMIDRYLGLENEHFLELLWCYGRPFKGEHGRGAWTERDLIREHTKAWFCKHRFLLARPRLGLALCLALQVDFRNSLVDPSQSLRTFPFIFKYQGLGKGIVGELRAKVQNGKFFLAPVSVRVRVRVRSC